MKRFLTFCGVAALALGVVSATPASAETGAQHWHIIELNGPPGKVITQGQFTGVGTVMDHFIVAPDGSFTNTAVQTFPQGVLTLASAGTSTFEFNPTTCIVLITITGSFHIVGGTGALTGITGSGTVSGKITTVLDRNAEGCEQGTSQVTYINSKADGVVTVP